MYFMFGLTIDVFTVTDEFSLIRILPIILNERELHEH